MYYIYLLGGYSWRHDKFGQETESSNSRSSWDRRKRFRNDRRNIQSYSSSNSRSSRNHSNSSKKDRRRDQRGGRMRRPRGRGRSLRGNRGFRGDRRYFKDYQYNNNITADRSLSNRKSSHTKD